LLRIDDINDLELTDFNSWDINLEAYQTALNYELDGKFEEARKIYKDNNLSSDMARVELNMKMGENDGN
jgi:hypothetical protein